MSVTYTVNERRDERSDWCTTRMQNVIKSEPNHVDCLLG